MKICKKNSNKILSILLVSTVLLLMNSVPVAFGVTVNECQVPLVIDLSYAIAGAGFAFEYSPGLEFVSYEKSDDVSSALTTPVVVKNGLTYLGFYNVDNRYVPEDGKLDMGYLVFNCLNDNSQQVTLTEIKLVQVLDNGATRSEFLAPTEIKVTPENDATDPSVVSTDDSSLIDAPGSSIVGADGVPLIAAPVKDLLVDNSEGSWWSAGFWITLALLFVLACGAGVFIITKKRVITT